MDKQTDIRLLAQRAYHYSHQLRASSAFVNLQRILAIDPKSAGSYYEQANLSVQHRNYSKAERLYKRATIMAPYFIDAYFNWAICLAKQRKFKPASRLFQRVIELNPDDLQAWCELGTVLIDQFLFKEAIGCFKRVLSTDPAFFMAYAPYGQALFYIGDFEKAMEIFEKVIEVEPKNWIANNTMGLYFLIKQHYEKAISCFEIVVNHNSAYTLSWINWSMVLLQEGKKDEAVEVFKKGMSLLNKVVDPNGREKLLELYTKTAEVLERIACQKEEKSDFEKTIESIKWILELLQNMKEEGQP